MKRIALIGLALVFWAQMANAEAPAAAAPPAPAAAPATPPASIRKLTVLPSNDTSNFNMGPALQQSMAALFQETQYYTVQIGGYAMGGFTEAEVARAFGTVGTEIIAFTYLEAERISLFLFDATHPKEFIVVAEALVDPMMGNSVTPQVIEYKFRVAFNNLLSQFYQSQFQPLPGSQSDPQMLSADAPDDPKRRAEESRRLFRELAALQETEYYVGASIGMARYAGGPTSSSNVAFGAYGGKKVSERVWMELGLDFFSYALAHVDARYHMPFAEKYLSLYASLGVGRIMGVISGPRFAGEADIPNGQIVFGPGISFDVPLLGAGIRGELKLFIGGGSILLGTYGLSYSI